MVTPTSVSVQTTKKVSLRDLATPLFRRGDLLVATFVVTLALSLFTGLVLMPPPYQSYMDLFVKSQRVDPVVTSEPTTQIPLNSTEVTLEEINSEVALLTSHDVLEKVAYALGLNKQPSLLDVVGFKQSEGEKVERAIRSLAKGIKADNRPNSNIIEVSFRSPNPQLAYDVLHDLSAFYLDKHAAVTREPGSFEFFAGETAKYESALQAAETDLKNFSRRQGLAAPDLERTNLASQVALTIGQYHNDEALLASDNDRIRSDRQQLKGIPARSPTMQVSSAADKLLGDLHSSLLAAQTRRTQLAMKYDPQYPLVREADEEIAQANAAIAAAESTHYISETTDRDPTYELLREDLARTESDIAAKRAAAAADNRAVQAMQRQMVDLDQDAVTLQDLQRQVKADEGNYLLYLSKREQERATNVLDETKFGNVTLAVPPFIPSLPLYSEKPVFLVAIFISLFLAIGAAYVVDFFDTSFHTPSQVADTLDIPVVIAMPKNIA